MNLSNIEELEFRDIGLRLFTSTPYPEFDYIVTPVSHPYCGNQSLFTYLRKNNFWLKWLDVTPTQVLDYTREQIAILIYNNPSASRTEILLTLLKIFRWGSENPLDKIAYDTVVETLNLVLGIDNIEDIIQLTYKNVWYSDIIMKPIRIQGETWKQYTERLRAGKVRARTKYKNQEAEAIVKEESLTLQSNSGGIIPTPQMLNSLTEIPVRKIKEVAEEDIYWQTKTKMNLQVISKILEADPNIKQKDIAEVLGVTERQVRKILKLK